MINLDIKNYGVIDIDIEKYVGIDLDTENKHTGSWETEALPKASS